VSDETPNEFIARRQAERKQRNWAALPQLAPEPVDDVVIGKFGNVTVREAHYNATPIALAARVDALEAEVKRLAALLPAVGTVCPFEWGDPALDESDPCPVCGDLGTHDSTQQRCVSGKARGDGCDVIS